ncbi:MAG: thymidylate synthase [Paracoccaceae bacterium]
MKVRSASLLAMGLLAACAPGNPFFGGGGGGGTIAPALEGVPASLSKNLTAVSYDAGAGTLVVQVTALDASVLQASYVRTPGLDVSGFEAYTMQETTLNRSFIALFAENPRGNLIAGVVADGGQFNRYYGGGAYSQIDVYSAPGAGGLANFIGSYAGVTNFNPLGGLSPGRTSGDVTFIADFTDMVVNGAIENRILIDDGSALVDVIMPATALAADGSFLGGTEYLNLQSSGVYGGAFGGVGATDVAGILVFKPIEGTPDIEEIGVFLLAQCGTAGDDPACP